MGKIAMCNLIVMTFDDANESKQIQSALHQLQENSAVDFDATLVTKDELGKLHSSPVKALITPVLPSIKALQQLASDKEFVQNVLSSIPQGSTALLMVTGEDDANTALLMMLMLFSPNAIPVLSPNVVAKNDTIHAHFQAEVETYQAAVTNLDALDADSTEVDSDVLYKAVDDAYDRLSTLFPQVSG